MKPTNNGNCKNGDSGHHYWRRCNNRSSRVSWKSALQDDSFRSRFLNKITGKIFQNFELDFLNFFLFARAWKTVQRKMIEQHSALKRILWSWQHPLYESKYQKKFEKKKRILRLAPEQQSLNFLTFSRTLAIIQEVNEKSCIFHASH